MKPLVLSFSASRHESGTFGQYIRKARLEKGLKQFEVATAVGVDENTIVNWEKATAMPRQYNKLRRMSETLGVKYTDLVDRFSPPPSNESGFGATLRKARIIKGIT